MKILIIGASGFLGKKIYTELSKQHEIAGTCMSKRMEGLRYLDITNRNGVEKFFQGIHPDLIIHTAAICNSDFCEVNKRRAWKVNVEGTRNLVYICKKMKIKLFYISTDYVFDGESGPYNEESKPNPINYYGLTKLEGERVVKEELYNYVILRPTILYGYNNEQDKETFVKKVIRSLKKEEELAVDGYTKKYPILIDDIAGGLRRLIEADYRGVVHMGGREAVTRYQWALKIAEVFGLNKNKIKPILIKPLARRPYNVNLKSEIIGKLGIKINRAAKGLEIIKRQRGCLFKLIYSLRPDKFLLGENVSSYRIEVGKQLAKEHPVKADIIVPVPESGIFAATGYSEELKIPLYFGLIRDYYTPKTLYEPNVEERNRALKRRLVVIANIIKNKSVVIVDEAILSGSTLKIVVKRLKDSGVKKIHIRIPAPPMAYKCPAGMHPENIKLIANKFKGDIRKIKEYFGVHSLKFLSLKAFLSRLKNGKEKCSSCFKGME